MLPLAVVLAYADGFWITSLRGAVGAIERTQSPFTDWVRESDPAACRSSSWPCSARSPWPCTGSAPSAHRRDGSLVTALLVAAAGTLAGVAELAASSAYDYHLQLHQDLHDGHDAADLHRGLPGEGGRRDSFWIQVRAVGWGSLILLVTNLVLVGWAVAFFGGRLKVSTTSGRRPRAPAAAPTTCALLLVAGLVGSAVIHAAVVPEHLTEWAAAGAFFVLLTAAEVAVAGSAAGPDAGHRAARRGRGLRRPAPAVAVLPDRRPAFRAGGRRPLRRSGWPTVPPACWRSSPWSSRSLLLRGVGWTRRPAASTTHLVWLGLVAVVAVTAIGLAGTELSWFDVVGSTMAHAG